MDAPLIWSPWGCTATYKIQDDGGLYYDTVAVYEHASIEPGELGPPNISDLVRERHDMIL